MVKTAAAGFHARDLNVMDMELPTVYARQQPAAGRRRLVVAASVVLAFAVVAVVNLAGGGARGNAGPSALGVDDVVEQFLKKHQQFDVSTLNPRPSSPLFAGRCAELA